MTIDFRDIEKLPVDFEEIVQTLKARIQNRLPNRWTDFLASNFGVELLEAVAYEATLMNYYLNSSVNECFMPTAKTQNAVYNLAKSIGYNPNPPSQSIVTLRFYIPSTHTYNINIPIYTKVLSKNGIPFYTIENKVLYAGETYVDVNAKSGTLYDETMICTGVANYKYTLKNYPVNSIEYVKVNNVEYTYAEFMDLETTDPYYSISYSNEFKASIFFGDGTYGSNPAKNSIIEIYYVTGADSSHNLNPYSINQISDTIYDSTNAIVTNISVINPQNSVGASDAETLDEVKRNAPSIYRTQNRCVTLQDFRDITIMQPGVNKVSVIDNSIMDEVGLFGVKVCVIPDGGGYPNTAFKESLLDTLENKKIISTQVDIIDPAYIPFDVNLTIQIQPKISSSVVTNRIRKVIYDYLYWENRDFGDYVSKQEIYRLISDVPGVLTIDNLTINENRTIYVNEVPANGATQITIIDSINTLNIGTKISILDLNGASALITTISDISNGVITINDPITTSMNIGQGSLIYPILEVEGDHKYGTKEITLKNESTPGAEVRDYALLNMSYLTIYFDNVPEKEYQILFRIGDVIYLNQPIDIDISDGTEITVLYKKNVPTLDSVATSGSPILKMKSYPRFSKGASLIRKEMISFDSDTISLTRSSSGIDYISSAMDTNYLSAVDRIYTNSSNVFIPNIDYVLSDNGKIITWTETGKAKITINTKYYIDIVKKVVNTTPTEIVHYVKNITGKYVEISPAVPERLVENTTFDYITDIYQLLPYEIADLGNININLI